MERVPFHDREMEISIQYHVMLIRQSSDQILMRCYIKYTIVELEYIIVIAKQGRPGRFQESSNINFDFALL